MRRAGRKEPGDDEWQFGPSSAPLDEDTLNQFNSQRMPRTDDPLADDPLAHDPLADEGDDYFGSDSRTDRREERARPGSRELEVEDDGEFIQALPDESGREPRPRHASERGGSQRRREGNGSRGASRGRRKSGREKQRRPKASGLPGERGEGVVRAINSERGFGFIETPTGDIFFHKSGVREDFTLLNVGARVAFVFGQGDNGIKAEDVAVLSG